MKTFNPSTWGGRGVKNQKSANCQDSFLVYSSPTVLVSSGEDCLFLSSSLDMLGNPSDYTQTCILYSSVPPLTPSTFGSTSVGSQRNYIFLEKVFSKLQRDTACWCKSITSLRYHFLLQETGCFSGLVSENQVYCNVFYFDCEL